MLSILFWLLIGTGSLSETQRKHKIFLRPKQELQVKWIPFLLLIDALILHLIIINL